MKGYGTSDSRKEWFSAGDYKKLPNEVGGPETAPSEEVAGEMKKLLTEYNAKLDKTFGDILEFHVQFERIYPLRLKPPGNGLALKAFPAACGIIIFYKT